MVERSKAEGLKALLETLEATTPDIEASAVVSVDGLMIASALPRDVEEDRVAAMSA
ncbi:MAG: roadblock/LC7 domain-containing protein, partial [Theionarchaea archaeon]|nr:roadblock/LC7 domain-containing protein [Theionarchaea archaeon]